MSNLIGIDLGTTFSCVGIYRRDHVEIIANEYGNYTTPSYVAFDDEEKLIGEEAKNQEGCNSENTIFDVKRLMGRRFTDSSVQEDMKLWPFKVIDGGDGNPVVKVNFKGKAKTFAPEEISSMILKKMVTIAQDYLGEPVDGAVITVPAHFNHAQRKATRRAGELAGLKMIKLMNEPTAAAVAYGFQTYERSGSGHILVVDIGGGTLDVTILNIENKRVKAKSTSGDPHLGGEDFNNRMVAHFVKEIKEKHKKDITDNLKSLSRLRKACEMAKLGLSNNKMIRVDVESLIEGKDFFTSISQAKFQQLNEDLFQKVTVPIKNALRDAELEISGIDDVLLVGGSTRIPKIREILKEFFNQKKMKKDINPDEAMAYGAAIQAAKLAGGESGDFQGLIIGEITPLSLGIQWAKELNSVIVPRNTEIPVTISRQFSTREDFQSRCRISVFEGERPLSKHNNQIGDFHLMGIRKAPVGEVLINVEFDIDCNGTLKVTATEVGTENKANISLSTEIDLDCDKVQESMQLAEQFRSDDIVERRRVQAKVDLHWLCTKLKSEFRRIDGLNKHEETARIFIYNKVCQTLGWIDAHPDVPVQQYQQMKKDIDEFCVPFRNSLIGRFPWMTPL